MKACSARTFPQHSVCRGLVPMMRPKKSDALKVWFVAAMLYSHSGLCWSTIKNGAEYLGADRLMFGADYPFVDQDVLLDILQKAIIRMPNWTAFSGKRRTALWPITVNVCFLKFKIRSHTQRLPKGFLVCEPPSKSIDHQSLRLSANGQAVEKEKFPR